MQKTIANVIPKIYCYTTPGVPYKDGWCKIGYTENDPDERIRGQSHTIDIITQKEWAYNAVYEASTDCFSDHDFHDFLAIHNIERREGTEWFKIHPDEAKALLLEFRERKAVTNALRSYRLREEQEKAVNNTLDYAKEHEAGEFLWNAKPRFGKTLSVYDFCLKMDAKKVLIVTGRPAIANSWYSDYMKFFGRKSGYFFIGQTDELKGKDKVVTWDDFDNTRKSNPDNDYKFIYFTSLQNLKGSVFFGGEHKKLKEIKLTDWDLLVIDEAHEGVDTYKTEVAFEQIKRRFTLHLTGTAFKALVKGKFDDDAIYNWTYVNEQEMKNNWNGEGNNPYFEMPRLNMVSYRIQNLLSDEIEKESRVEGDIEFGFKLNALFECNSSGAFKHEDAIDRFLDVIASDSRYPFSPDYGDKLTHTFWLLYRVNSVKALEKKLRVHPVFKDYEVIIAAGDGKKDDLDDAFENKKSFAKVREAVENYKSRGKVGTITLSVGQLTTGVTIPEWTGVMMLSEQSSPERYMQTIFRVQNPWFYYEDGEYHRKESAYVFDFNQEKALTMMEQFANDLSTDTAGGKGTAEERERNVRRLVNCFPIYGEDDGGHITELSPSSILSIPRSLKSDEVVKSKFMSNDLFVNTCSVFRAPKEVLNIFRKMPTASKHEAAIKITPETADRLHLNEKNEVEVPQDVVTQKVDTIVPPARREAAKREIVDTVQRQFNTEKPKTESATKSEQKKFVEALAATTTQTLLAGIKEQSSYAVSPAMEKSIKNNILKDAEAYVNKCYQKRIIDKSDVEEEIKEQVGPVNTKEDEAALTQLIEEAHAGVDAKFRTELEAGIPAFTENKFREIVGTIECQKSIKEKNEYEDEVRDHLRGFARTIPSFIMAYGNDPECIGKYGELSLKNFDLFVPGEVFKEVTSITIAEFKMLRDGGTYPDANGDLQEYEGHVFEEIVFNDSIRKFLEYKKKLADYFDEMQTGDIFDYIPLQKTNQKFTPKSIVAQMISRLEEENPGCFDRDDFTFIDIYMKSGLFITEIVKRLYRSDKMKVLYPDGRQRLKHIFEHQVYGLAPTEIIFKIATNFIFGSELTNGINTNHFVMLDAQPHAEDGSLEMKLEELFEK